MHSARARHLPAARDRSRRRPDRESRSGAARARRAGASQDLGFYRCGCGCTFTAEVTTSVGCPRCGARQAW
jgi:hypothetical protein